MSDTRAIPAIGIVGYSGSGKTTLIERLIPLLKAKGWKIGTLKHDAHRFDIDKPGKDTYRHREAGAEAVIINSKDRLALMVEQSLTLSIDQQIGILAQFQVTAVLVEGYKESDLPKIGVLRREADGALLHHLNQVHLLAVGGDSTPEAAESRYKIPAVSLDAVSEIADYIHAFWSSC